MDTIESGGQLFYHIRIYGKKIKDMEELFANIRAKKIVPDEPWNVVEKY